MSPIITDLAGTGAAEGFILDPDGDNPLDVVSGGQWGMVSLVIPPAARLPQWASNGDSDGQQLVREPYYGNRDQCQMVLRAVTETMDQAMNSVGLLEGKLQEAIKLAAGGGPGLPFRWTPQGATVGLTGYMLLAEITDMPIDWNGWFQARPTITVKFTAKPFLYGDEVLAASATGSDPLLTVEVESVAGDVSAEARLVITDGSSQARRWVEWGLEQRYYDAASPAPLFIDSADLVTSGFAGAGTALSGAYGGSAISTTLLSQPVAVCGTDTLPHVGTFRVKARVWAASTDEYWRLAWHEGDGWLGGNSQVQPVAPGAFNELDLGEITIDVAQAGTQEWSGRIEAWTSSAGGELAAVDYLAFLPTEQYGRLEGTYAYSPGVITGHDEFSGASGTLNSRTAAAGGAWATSGAATDFTEAADPLDSSNPVESRSTTASESGPRFAILGSTSRTDSEVSINVHFSGAGSGEKWAYAIARYVDSSNYAYTRILRLNTTLVFLELGKQIAGSPTTFGDAGFTLPLGAYTQLRLVVYATGHLLAWALDANGNILASLEATDADLATGGTLATGKAGFADLSSGAESISRYYDNFYAGTPIAEPLVVNAGKSLEVRSDSNLRQSADGASYPDIPSRGSRLFIPPAGDADRIARIAVRATREDVITSASQNNSDSLTIAVHCTPRYLAVPRS